MNFGNSEQERKQRIADQTRAIGDDAAAHDLDIAQEQEILTLSERWNKNHKDIEAQAEKRR